MKQDIERLVRGRGSTSPVAQFLHQMGGSRSEQRNHQEIPWTWREKNTGVEKSVWTRLLETKTEKKWTRKKWPKPLLPHPCSIFDIADLEYRNSANFIRSGWVSVFQSCQNFRNRSIVAKTVHLFVRTVGFGVATTPSHSYPDNRLHIWRYTTPKFYRGWELYIWRFIYKHVFFLRSLFRDFWTLDPFDI